MQPWGFWHTQALQHRHWFYFDSMPFRILGWTWLDSIHFPAHIYCTLFFTKYIFIIYTSSQWWYTKLWTDFVDDLLKQVLQTHLVSTAWKYFKTQVSGQRSPAPALLSFGNAFRYCPFQRGNRPSIPLKWTEPTKVSLVKNISKIISISFFLAPRRISIAQCVMVDLGWCFHANMAMFQPTVGGQKSIKIPNWGWMLHIFRAKYSDHPVCHPKCWWL